MLSRHILVIAAIFVPYFTLMAGIFAYIIRTGRARTRKDRDDRERNRDRANMQLVA